ncbi:MAG: low-specificity L-threonine aldolase [Leptolyngbyaceae cyanobacterium SM1_1_3]|nr:low-specificity L-threonine aldolase [Leptolyngbyaceae cyanobacterium SM1_1_3]NJN01566.1 low-specificity L-threonine aldolase [Leptolyngbyaceae cyanobacterium RM1_1_2]NJO09826.1 low-specificity L-threonine aldolase [Leptolyngbyaceae cyanobacterium SL_1_1]
MDSVDFRSDTVTWPTPKMREAMAKAQVGDDVYGEDPTVKALEQLAADKLGKAAGLFVASGTQGNLIAALTHTNRGDEIIMGCDAHTFCWEAGGAAVLGGVTPLPLPTDSLGRMNLAQIEASIRGDDPHWPHSRLITVENSSGGNNGAAIPANYFAAIRQLSDRHQLRVHLDGARLFNAATALSVEAKEIAQHVDSASICLSKGLCAPVGSVLVGDRSFIHQARRYRKLLGGGMRQAGVLAAAGLIALETMSQRLGEDHLKAQRLAQGIATVSGLVIDPSVVQTNMVFFTLADTVPLTAQELVNKVWQTAEIKLGTYGDRKLRAVTHYWIQPDHVDALVNTLKAVLK